MPQRQTRRPLRIAELIKSELMSLLLRGAVRDPRAKDALISGVTMSPDLKHARVFVRLADSQKSDTERKEAVRTLNGASKYLRKELAPRLGLKYVPEMRFFWDDRADHAARVESLLEEIRVEQCEQDGADSD